MEVYLIIIFFDHSYKDLDGVTVTDRQNSHRGKCTTEIFIITMTENYLIESDGFGMKLISTIRPDEEIGIE